MSDKPHLPHWKPGMATKTALADREDAERFTHMAYGELVKHFGLGATYRFDSWDRLPTEVRERWIAALTELREDQREAEANPVNARPKAS